MWEGGLFLKKLLRGGGVFTTEGNIISKGRVTT